MPAFAEDNHAFFVRAASANIDIANGFPNHHPQHNNNTILANKLNGSASSSSSPRCGSSPSSPLSTSPRSSLQPMAALRRSLSSTFSLIPEEDPRNAADLDEDAVTLDASVSIFGLITWLPRKAFSIAFNLLALAFRPAWGQMLVVLPTLWIAAWLYLFWKSIQCPLNILRWCGGLLTSKSNAVKRRTVLVSSGGSIQALHLARNLYCAGARVIVLELDGHFGLAKFSMAVDKFYTIARPTPTTVAAYVDALRDIVEREQVNYYIPVCATSSAYYDAIAKPQLEAVGCSCFVPGSHEVSVLDDIAEVMHRCQEMTKPTPLYTVVASKQDVDAWYDDDAVPHRNKYFMASCGTLGISERVKFIVPPAKRDFRLSHAISEERPWVIVQDVAGDHFLTCTTVKASQVVANVTCRIHPKNRGLTHEANKEIDAWLKHFFARLAVQRPITGHVTFRFVRDHVTGLILPLGAKVGVSLPYICHTTAHAKLLWKPCPHFSRQKSVKMENAWMHEAVSNTLKYPGVEALTRLIGSVLDKREALFAYWDPLPYCAYYHLQIPFSSVLGYVQTRNVGTSCWPARGSALVSNH